MRLALKPDSVFERIGLAVHKVPTPAGRTFNAMAVARTIGVAQQVGVFTMLSSGSHTSDEVARNLNLQPQPTRMTLDVLAGEGLLSHRAGRYELSAEGRRWLSPKSPTYLGTFVEHTASYWEWWAGLEDVLRRGTSFEIHRIPDDDPSWPVYIRGQYELARLSAGSIAKAIKVPRDATSVLDLGGGHGWYSGALCRANPGLHATVVDLPASAAVGKVIIDEVGMGDVVTYRSGDVLSTDLGGPHDLVLCFSLLHHLTGEQTQHLLSRARSVLRPGGRIAILDMFHPEGPERRRSSAAVFELFFHLTSGVDTLSDHRLQDHLQKAGFKPASRRDLPALPDLRLYIAPAG